ncbi:MAG: hypothetical protein AAF664_16695 [Planctomycetota bacterium]
MFKSAIRSTFAVIALATVFSVAAPQTSNAGGWEWNKPLNKRVGHAFYTSNRNANFQKRQHRTNYRYSTPSRRYSSGSKAQTPIYGTADFFGFGTQNGYRVNRGFGLNYGGF